MISVKGLTLNENINNIYFDCPDGSFLSIMSNDNDALKKFFKKEINYIGYTLNNDITIDNPFYYVETKSINSNISIFDYIASGIRKIYSEKICFKKVDDLLSNTSLYRISGVSVSDLSLNQMVLVRILRLIIDEAPVIVLDESIKNNSVVMEALINLNGYYRFIFLGFKNELTTHELLIDNSYKYDYIELIEYDHNEIKLDANYKNNTLNVLDNEIVLNELYQRRILGEFNNIRLKRKYFSFDNLSNDLAFKVLSSSYKNGILEVRCEKFTLYFNYYKDTNNCSYVFYPIDEIDFYNDETLESVGYVSISNNIKCNVINPYLGLINIDGLMVSINKKINRKTKFISLDRNYVYELSISNGLKINRIFNATRVDNYIYLDGIFNSTRLNIKVNYKDNPIDLIGKYIKVDTKAIITNNYY